MAWLYRGLAIGSLVVLAAFALRSGLIERGKANQEDDLRFRGLVVGQIHAAEKRRLELERRVAQIRERTAESKAVRDAEKTKELLTAMNQPDRVKRASWFVLKSPSAYELRDGLNNSQLRDVSHAAAAATDDYISRLDRINGIVREARDIVHKSRKRNN